MIFNMLVSFIEIKYYPPRGIRKSYPLLRVIYFLVVANMSLKSNI